MLDPGADQEGDVLLRAGSAMSLSAVSAGAMLNGRASAKKGSTLT